MTEIRTEAAVWQHTSRVFPKYLLGTPIKRLQDTYISSLLFELGAIVVPNAESSPAMAQQTAFIFWYCRESFSCKHSGFQASDVQDWAALTGDTNPLHVCESAARDAGDWCCGPNLSSVAAEMPYEHVINCRFCGRSLAWHALCFIISSHNRKPVPWCTLSYTDPQLPSSSLGEMYSAECCSKSMPLCRALPLHGIICKSDCNGVGG